MSRRDSALLYMKYRISRRLYLVYDIDCIRDKYANIHIYIIYENHTFVQ